MNEEQLEVTIARLEHLARQQPAIYKLRVGLLATLGYAYIFLLLAGLLAVFVAIALITIESRTVNSGFLQLAIVALGSAIVVLKSMWVQFPPPAGLELQRLQVSRLFALVDELTSKLQAPRFHHILLTEDFNAAVVQIPRLGILGWQQNYLLLGLPLMQALSPEQFRAVLAHELGHLSGNHSRFTNWIYRVQKTYIQILERLHQGGHKGTFALFERFFDWYAPFFSAYSFVLRRMNEYEADRCAAELAGAKNTAEALINVEVKARFLESSFWPEVRKQVDYQVEPPQEAFTTMFGALRTNVNPEDATKWLEQALAQKTSNADTHPCLFDRLSALKYLPVSGQQIMPAAVKAIAAEEFLGDALKALTAHFDRTWKEQVATPWRQRYAYARESQSKLQALDEKAQNQQLTLEEAWDRARWTAEFKSNEAAIALFQYLLAIEPEHASANYAFGQILIQQNDAAGIGYIEKAIENDPDNVIPGCELLYSYLMQQGQIEKAKACQKRIEKHYNLVMLARQERSAVSDRDRFQHHGLPAAAVQQLCEQLSRYPQLKEAYLVQKVVKYFPQKPFYVLGVTRHHAWYKLNTSDRDDEFLKQLVSEVQFPGLFCITILNDLNDENGNNKKLGKILGKIEGALIYRR